jgi:hypothetical protein
LYWILQRIISNAEVCSCHFFIYDFTADAAGKAIQSATVEYDELTGETIVSAGTENVDNNDEKPYQEPMESLEETIVNDYSARNIGNNAVVFADPFIIKDEMSMSSNQSTAARTECTSFSNVFNC